MFFSDGYLLYYILGIVLIPGILFGLWAQYKVTSTYKKYEKVATTQGITASMFARKLLDNGKLQSIKVAKISGELTPLIYCHFFLPIYGPRAPKTNTER